MNIFLTMQGDESEPKHILPGLPADVLKRMVRVLGISGKFQRKAEMVGAITARLQSNLSAAVQLCSEAERAALAAAAYDGPVDPGAFRARTGHVIPAMPRTYGSKTVSPFHGLAHPDESGRLIVGPVTARALQELLPKPPAATVVTSDEPPTIYHYQTRYYTATDDDSKDDPGRAVRVYEGEAVVFTELRQVLALMRTGSIRVTPKQSTPTVASVRKLTEVLAVPDFDLDAPAAERSQWHEEPGPVRAFAWGVLTQACGWCRAKAGKLELTRSGQGMLAGDPADLKKGVERFLASSSFDELRRIDHIRGQSGKGQRSLSNIAERKMSIVDAICQWPPGKWIAIDEAWRFQIAGGLGFQVAGDAWNLYFEEKQYGSLGYAGGEGHLERQYLRAFLFESMATLGLVDVAYVRPHWLWPEFEGWWGTDDLPFCGRYDGLLYVRLNDLGAFCLDLTPDYQAPVHIPRQLFKVLPNRDLVLNHPAPSASDIATLGMFAERTADNVWHLSRHAMLTHLERGGSMQELREALETHADNDVPGNVHTFLDDVERQATSIRSVEDALLIDCGDAATAAELAADTGTGKHCMRAGDQHVVVRKKNERAFRSAARRAGLILPL